MRIRVRYGFYTDGDYSLKNPENFGCTKRETVLKIGSVWNTRGGTYWLKITNMED